MKLFELTGIKSLKDRKFNEVINLFSENGTYKKIGDGVFAIAFLKVPGVIYKFWIHDPSYEKYVNYCLLHQDNPYLPKFKSKIKTLTTFFDKPLEFPNKIKYIKMEYLEPLKKLNSKITFDVITDIIHEVMYGNHKSTNEFIESISTEKVYDDLHSQFDEIIYIYEFIKDMIDHGIRVNDLHDENVMVRNNSQIVITDPMVNWNDIDKMHLIMKAVEKYQLKQNK